MRKHPVSPPSPYRCLNGLRLSAAAVIIMLALGAFERAACSLLDASAAVCLALQAPYPLWLTVAAAGGLVHTLYAAYRDFFLGRYYSDLARVQQH